MAQGKENSTKEKILLATEKLVAEHGFDAVSLRDITTAAEVNVAAVNYHFGSKESLFEAVQLCYVLPVNEERLRLLDDVMTSCEVPDVRQILEAFMRPFLTMVKSSKMSEQLFFKLMGRCLIDQQGNLPESMMPSLREMAHAFQQAFSKALPDRPVTDLMWRLHFSFGVMAHTLMYGEVVKNFTPEKMATPDFEQQLSMMIDFCAAGFLHDERGDA